jgi:DNA-directed RNA polymerase specialized sigma24 family protein
MTQLTELLVRLHAGDESARGALFAASYSELHRLAQSRLRDRGRHLTLDATSLVHETYLRFIGAGSCARRTTAHSLAMPRRSCGR